MSSSITVRYDASSSKQIPACAAAGMALLLHLRETGFLPCAVTHARVNRQGGHPGLSAVLFLLLFFANPTYRSLKKFNARVSPFSVQLAAIWERDGLISTSALSRLLGRVTDAEVDCLEEWLLLVLPGVDELLQRPDVCHQDRQGERWHLVDFDPTVSGVRERALAEEDDLPEGRRRNAGIASRMRTGRKRGKLGIRSGALYHQGAGAWLHLHVGSGVGVHAQQFESAVATAARLSTENSTKVMMLADGEFGTNRCYSICRAKKMALITRTSRYEILDSAVAKERMRTGIWMRVPDGGSGPKRWAMDLGEVRFRVGKGVVHSDGSEVEPQTARVVVSRISKADASGAGKQLGDEKFEMFVALDVPQEAFSAEQVVFLFYARTGIENNFLLAKCQQFLGRTYSRNPAGQRLATLVAFAVWNLEAAFGAKLGGHGEPKPGIPVEQDSAGELFDLPKLDDVEVKRLVQPTDAVVSKRAEPVAEVPKVTNPCVGEDQRLLREALGRLPWRRLLQRRLGWRWDPENAWVVNADGTVIKPVGVEEHQGGVHRLRCIAGDKSQATFSLHIEAKEISELSRRFENKRRHTRPVSGRKRAKPKPEPTLRIGLLTPATDRPPAQQAIKLPSLMTADARNKYTWIIEGMHIQIVAKNVLPRADREITRFHRQHRRLTWSERALFGALAPGVDLTVSITGARPPWMRTQEVKLATF